MCLQYTQYVYLLYIDYDAQKNCDCERTYCTKELFHLHYALDLDSIKHLKMETL